MRYFQQTNTNGKTSPDVKDRRILTLLAANARTPLTAIAKQVGLSRDAVHYRIESLTKQGIIQGYRTIVDITQFGYGAYHIFLRLARTSKEIEESLIAKFQKYPFARAVITCRGKYDVELAVIARSNHEFSSVLDTVLSDCGKNLQEYDVLITAGSYVARVLPTSFHAALAQKTKTATIGKNNQYSPDEKDISILRALANDATLPLHTIAQKAKISDDTVMYRMRKMIASGTIKQFVPVINFAGLEYSVYAVLVRTGGLSQQESLQLKETLSQDKNVLWAIKCVGRYNILTYICTKNTDDLNETLSILRERFGASIIDYEILIAYEEHKYTYFPEYGL